MRSTFLLLGAFSTANAHRQADADAAVDSQSLLQARTMVRKHASEAETLLSNLKEMAKSLQGDAFAKTDPTEVTDALGSANDALTLMFPGFVQEHASAQHQVNIQMGEIQACHDSVNHGLAARAQHVARTAARRAESEECDAALAEAIETQIAECAEYTELAGNLINGGLPGCTAGDASQLVDVGRSWRDWVNRELGNLEQEQLDCHTANAAVDSQSQLCSTLADAFEQAFCRTNEACIHHNSCFAHEVEIYEEMRAEIEAAALIRQQQYITAMQAQCLVELMMDALMNGTPIPDNALTACDDVDVSDLVINFPEVPEAPADCPPMQAGDPPCAAVPHVLGWTAGIADDGAIDLTCKDGSPDGCACELLDVQGYSAGVVVRCENGLMVSKSTDTDSCPIGFKIFSPQDRADVDLLAPYMTRHTPEGRKVHSPHLLVDVTRPEDGCGGCTGAAMNSNTPAQASWRTQDGSPWWLADAPFGEPNGDYHANCYLYIHEVHSSHVHFNDARHGACHYSSNAYLCQPVRHYEEPSCTCELKSHLHGLGSEFQTITEKDVWVDAVFASGGRGVSALELTKTGGEGSCIARIAHGTGGANALSHVYTEGAHNYPLPTGNDNIGSFRLECAENSD